VAAYKIFNTAPLIYIDSNNNKASIKFERIKAYRYIVTIKHATSPLKVTFTDNYNSYWQLSKPGVNFNNYLVQGEYNKYYRHTKINGYANNWTVDVERLCKEQPDICTANVDSTYDLKLIIEFWPQRLFWVGLGISIITLLSCIGYLVFDIFKQRMEVKHNVVTS